MKLNTQVTTAEQGREPLWTARDVQNHFQISPATYFRWISEGKLPKGIKIGRTVRHPPSDICKVGQ